ncbi:MAG: aldose 1-epimerase [Leptospiraceae bacterium]|nr:aldose 1-epimerase [Leptospiraceae bacterium]MCP5510362.1 aldose 1-epimerase [Leptospiraceae bacterium]
MKIILWLFLVLAFHYGCMIPKYTSFKKKHSLLVLENPTSFIRLEVLPEVGNLIYQIYIRNEPILYSPDSVLEYAHSNHLQGIPFLHPWVNRLEGDYFHWKDKRYEINPKNSKLRRDKNQLPIHGILSRTEGWKVTRVYNHSQVSVYEATYDFEDQEDLEVFPFPHKIGYKIIVEGNTIKVSLEIFNTGREEMPVSSGFHPYFLLPESAKEKTYLRTNMSMYYKTDSLLLPTGKKAKANEIIETPKSVKNFYPDHVLSNPKDPSENPKFTIEFPDKSIDLEFGRIFTHGLVFLPRDRDLICIEPMSTATNALNLQLKDPEVIVPSVQPGEKLDLWFQLTFH